MKSVLKHFGFSMGVLLLWATMIVWFATPGQAIAADNDPAHFQLSPFDPVQIVDNERDISWFRFNLIYGQMKMSAAGKNRPDTECPAAGHSAGHTV